MIDPEEASEPLEGGGVTKQMGPECLETGVEQSTQLPSLPGLKCSSCMTDAKLPRFGDYYSSWSTLRTLFCLVLFSVSSDILNQIQ